MASWERTALEMSETEEEGAATATAALPLAIGGGRHGKAEDTLVSDGSTVPVVTGCETEAAELVKPPGPRLCGVCDTQVGKYKCPRCTMQ